MRATEHVVKKGKKIRADFDSLTESAMAQDGARFPLRETPFSVADLALRAPAMRRRRRKILRELWA